VATLGGNLEDLRHHARKLGDRGRSLSIPHGGSPHGVVTVSIGGVCRVPQREADAAEFSRLAEVALLQAKQRGRDQVNVVS
jgi:two-component system chemotaxis family response regulator WspR